MDEPTTHNSVSLDSMSLKEARSVMWLRSNYRPLGELLDTGYLNQARLEWASTKAYDPRLKLAATMLLDWLRKTSSKSADGKPPIVLSSAPALPAIDVEMTVEQARATLWPLVPFKGRPIGPLVDTKQLSLKDLGYAIENAWEGQVRRAAVVLMALRLHQAVTEPAPSAGPLKVESAGRSFAQRRETRLTLAQGAIFGGVLVGALIYFAWLIGRPKPAPAPSSTSLSTFLASPINIAALLILLALGVGAVWLSRRLLDQAMKRLEKQIENARKGQEGEQRVIEIMHQILDENWTLFRNVVLPGRNKADLDAILVGPPGVWVLEVKTLAGEYRNIGEHWEYRTGKRWKLLKSSPSRQARDNAIRLADFLKADGISQWCTPVVIWAEQDSPLIVENPSVATWTLDRLSDELGNVWQGQAVSEPDRSHIMDKLTKLCQRSKAAQVS